MPMPKFYIYILLVFGTLVRADDVNVAIIDINRAPSLFVDRLIQIEGKVYLSGDYWGRHTWYLVDGQGERVPLLPWRPYELMHPPPGSTARMPDTMMKFIDKYMSLSATLRVNTGNYPNMHHPYYLEVMNANIIVPKKP